MKKNVLKLTAATFSIIGAGIILFNSAAEMALAANNGKVEKVPTSYQVSDSLETALPKPETKEEDGGKVNYFVSMDSLNTGTPTDTDLTMEEAAETGNQYLKDIFGLDLEGAYVSMSYNPGTVTFPRAFWDGDVRFGEEVKTDDDTWHFFIDAVTGELFMLSCSETLDVDVQLGYDSSLENNYGVYAEAAKEIAERCDLVGGPVADVKYGSQGYGSNNPDITMEVYGENGQIANLTFSRYNQRFLGLITDTSRVITDRAMEDLMKEDAEATDWQTETLEDGSVIQWREQ